MNENKLFIPGEDYTSPGNLCSDMTPCEGFYYSSAGDMGSVIGAKSNGLVTKILKRYRRLIKGFMFSPLNYVRNKIKQGYPRQFNVFNKWIIKQIRKIRGLFRKKER